MFPRGLSDPPPKTGKEEKNTQIQIRLREVVKPSRPDEKACKQRKTDGRLLCRRHHDVVLCCSVDDPAIMCLPLVRPFHYIHSIPSYVYNCLRGRSLSSDGTGCAPAFHGKVDGTWWRRGGWCVVVLVILSKEGIGRLRLDIREAETDVLSEGLVREERRTATGNRDSDLW